MPQTFATLGLECDRERSPSHWSLVFLLKSLFDFYYYVQYRSTQALFVHKLLPFIIHGMKLNHITLVFTGPSKELEKPFLKSYFRKYLAQSIITHFVIIFSWLGSSILDIVLFPEIKPTLLTIRFVVLIVFVLGFILSFSSMFFKIWQALFTFFIVIAGMNFLAMIIITSQPLNYFYSFGVIVCMILGYILPQIRFITSLKSGWFLFISYEFVNVWLMKMPMTIFIASSYYLGGVNVLGMIISYIMEHNERKIFFQSYQIERANCDLADEIKGHKQTENKLIAALKQKEIYLKEMNHRVKNNLQVISSLLDMTCNHSKIPLVQKTLTGARTKIQAISSVHHQLYKNEDVRQIDMEKQIHDLYHNLSMVYASGCQIITEIKVYGVNLSLDQAMPCTLVVNELISNALEHAFVERTKGTFKIHMKQSDQMVYLNVRDDGIGLPIDLNMEKVESLGLKLVQILVTKQLKGQIQVTCARGTSFVIQFENWNH